MHPERPASDSGTEVLAPSPASTGGERPRWYSHPYNRAEFYRLAALLAGLPRRSRLRLVRGLARAAPRLLPVERAVVRRTLERVTGASPARLDTLVRATFEDFAVFFSDLVSTNRRPSARLEAQVAHVSGTEWLDELGRGVVSLTAHVGNWEMAGRLLARRAARPTHVVVAEEEVRELQRWVRRDGDGVRFVSRSRPTVSLDLVAALRRAEVVAIQGDRALGTRGDLLIPFFGRPAPFPIGPFVLARAAGVPIVRAFCLLEPDDRYRVTVLPPISVERGGEADAARTWVTSLEGVVREHPTQWFNFFDVWSPFGP